MGIGNRHFVSVGRVNYLGQPMLQPVCRCQAVPRIVIGAKSKQGSGQ